MKFSSLNRVRGINYGLSNFVCSFLSMSNSCSEVNLRRDVFRISITPHGKHTQKTRKVFSIPQFGKLPFLSFLALLFSYYSLNYVECAAFSGSESGEPILS